MYKTVRKGDASLQYTILPQTDQFSSFGFPQTADKPRPRIIRYTMATLMVLIILSCVATPFLMNQNDHNLFAGSVLAMGRVGYTTGRNAVRSQAKDDDVNASESRNSDAESIVATTELLRRKDLEVETTLASVDISKEDGQDLDDVTTESISSTTQRLQASAEVSLSSRATTASSVPSSTRPMPTTTLFKIPPSTSTESTKTVSGVLKKAKMPRVTLKLRENETIPQMYVRAGIASYKKGNITTSVLAHGLSLEGLVFKTPEGTIKPWPEKWFYTGPSAEIQWKNTNDIILICVIGGVLTGVGCVFIVWILYVQRKVTRRLTIEEGLMPDDEDQSTLLDTELQGAEEKE